MSSPILPCSGATLLLSSPSLLNPWKHTLRGQIHPHPRPLEGCIYPPPPFPAPRLGEARYTLLLMWWGNQTYQSLTGEGCAQIQNLGASSVDTKSQWSESAPGRCNMYLDGGGMKRNDEIIGISYCIDCILVVF